MTYITKYCPPISITTIKSLTIASDGSRITGLWMENQKYYGRILESVWVEQDLPVFKETKEWLDMYFLGQRPNSALPLSPKGSDFRQKVWKILLDIPYGQVITYGDIAKSIAKLMGIERMSSQAVGGAVGHNPISILIPCHRVIGTNGNLIGYAGGIETKIELLTLEQVNVSKLYLPPSKK